MWAERIVIFLKILPSHLGGYSTSCGVRPKLRQWEQQSLETDNSLAGEQQFIRKRCSA